MKHGFWHGIAGATIVAALAVGGAGAAHAAPLPGTGSSSGGVVVRIPAQADVRFTQISAGESTTVALDVHGVAFAWGSNSVGQLGNGAEEDHPTPVRVSMPAGVRFTQLESQGARAVALGADGKAYAWGNGADGRIGNGGLHHARKPIAVHMPTGVAFRQISAGGGHALALGTDGKAYAWGDNAYGQLGDGTITDRSAPVAVRMPDGVSFTQISAGGRHSVAIGSDGKTYAWGHGESGKLGNGTAENRSTPMPVTQWAPEPYVQISAGASHTLAIDTAGRTFAWGSNNMGRLGDGTMTDRLTPQLVHLPLGVSFARIAAGGQHSLAIDTDGRGYAWGYNDLGMLGDGTATTRTRAVEIAMPGGTRLTSISGGDMFSLGIDAEGKVHGWGSDAGGALGIGEDTVEQKLPVRAFSPARTTGVFFGGAAGALLSSHPDGSSSVRVPRHAPGRVDVTVTWELGGVNQVPKFYLDSFAFVGKLTATPKPRVVVSGGGKAKVGKRLTVKAGTWKPARVTLKYRWLRNGKAIKGATKSKYRITKKDRGKRISVRVTGTKAYYGSVSKTSGAKKVSRTR